MQVRTSLENATMNSGRPSGQTPKPALRVGKTPVFGIFCSAQRCFSSLVGIEPSLAGHIFVVIWKISGKIRQAARPLI
jgi:hypothetical protein